MRRPRRNHSAAFKAKVALEAICGEQPLAELATKFDVHATQIAQWKAELLKGAEAVFDYGKPPPDKAADLNRLHAKIGQLTLENNFFRDCAHQSGIAERKAMIDRNHTLAVTRQAELLGMSRGSVHYLPRPPSAADLALMRRLDELHLEHPFMGARMLRDPLRREGIRAGRRHIGTLTQRMGIQALAPQPGASKRAPGHKIHPYLLRRP